MNGLATCRSAPAARLIATCSVDALAVSMINGTRRRPASLRSFRSRESRKAVWSVASSSLTERTAVTIPNCREPPRLPQEFPPRQWALSIAIARELQRLLTVLSQEEVARLLEAAPLHMGGALALALAATPARRSRLLARDPSRPCPQPVAPIHARSPSNADRLYRSPLRWRSSSSSPPCTFPLPYIARPRFWSTQRSGRQERDWRRERQTAICGCRPAARGRTIGGRKQAETLGQG